MTKGIKRELSLEEEVVELDRLLIASMRRNLSLAEGLQKNASNEKGRTVLERHFSRHALVAKKGPVTPPEESTTVSETDKWIRRFDRYLAALPEEDLENVMDLVKSMCRSRKARAPKRSKRGNNEGADGGDGQNAQAVDGP